jgi:hypothetical protein
MASVRSYFSALVPLVLIAGIWVTGCSTAKLKKPAFMTNDKEQTTAQPAPALATATPRELLTAVLVNKPKDENSPRMTVGKLIEFADRYLSCDCSTERFVRSWQKLPHGYRLITNSNLVQPLNLTCSEFTEPTQCFLAEIDRGSHVQDLNERFIPGANFIQFIYENGIVCRREEPCPDRSAASP